MRRALGWVFGLVVIVASTSLLLAKGVTTKILRGCEGQWFRATAAWQRAFRTALARR